MILLILFLIVYFIAVTFIVFDALDHLVDMIVAPTMGDRLMSLLCLIVDIIILKILL